MASTRLELASVAGLFVGELASEVVVAGAGWAADLDQGDEVQGVVELAVTGTRQLMSGVLAAGDFEGSGAGVAGEVGRGGEARGPTGAAKQPPGDDRADADGLGESAAECRDGVLEPLVDHGQPSIQAADVGDQVPGDLLAGAVGGGQGAETAQQRGGRVGAELAWSATRDEIAQHRMK